MLSGQRSHIVDNDALPESLANGDEPCVVLAFGLVKLVVLKRLEMQGGCIVERMVGHWPGLGLSRSSDITALEIRNLSEPANLDVEKGAFCRGEVLAKPEDSTVNKHRVREILDFYRLFTVESQNKSLARRDRQRCQFLSNRTTTLFHDKSDRATVYCSLSWEAYFRRFVPVEIRRKLECSIFNMQNAATSGLRRAAGSVKKAHSANQREEAPENNSGRFIMP